MTSPLITIAITCFNARDTIQRALDSAIAQNWPNKEILIFDDASRDGSADIVATLIKSTDHARLIASQDNKGPGGARNTLLNEAKGEFIAFFDDDDESLPERVRVQYERITSFETKTHETMVACYASGIRYYPNGYKKSLPAIGVKPIIPKGEGLAESILFFGRKENWDYGSGTPTCCLMARTSVLKQVGGFDPNFRRVEDLDLTIRLALKNTSFIGCSENLFIQHATIGGDKTSTKNLEAELQLAEKYKDFLKSKGMYDYAKTWPKIRYYHFSRQYALFAANFLKLLLKYPVKAISHILQTGPKRLKHEKKMAA